MNQISDPRNLRPPQDVPGAGDTQVRSGQGRFWLLAGAAVVVAGLLGWGAWQHVAQNGRAADAQKAAEDYAPTVRVQQVKKEDGPVKIVLPGATSPIDSARLFARATGYIGERRVDIGSRVKQGDLLLRISAPDQDAQLAQAQAQLEQTKAALTQAQANLASAQSNVNLAKATNNRTSTLASQGWETKQNADNTQANVSAGSAGVDAAAAGITVAQANIAAQYATVQRLQALVGFENVIAPMNGIITSRSADRGDLVNADTGGGTPLLEIQDDDVLRVAVFVPQSDAVSLRDGLHAAVTVPELPGQTFDAVVARSSVALDPTSRTVQAEVDVPNADHRLRAGLYVQVAIEVPREAPAAVVPDEAIILGADGPHVAVVEGDHVRLHPIEIARDFGTSAEVRAGLDGGEQIVMSPPTGLADGAKVKVQQPASGDGPPKTQGDGTKKTS